jgi:hypothetical protein
MLQPLGTQLHQHAASGPAQPNESDFQWKRSEIAELRPEQRQRPGQATGNQSEARDPKTQTQSRVVQRVSPLSGGDAAWLQ